MKRDEHLTELGRALRSRLEAYLSSFGEADHRYKKRDLADMLWDNKASIILALEDVVND
jgi:hypothetical protein